MKVKGPSKSQNTKKSGKAQNVSKGDSTFGDMVANATSKSSSTSATQSIARVDALLSVQAADSATERGTRQRMRDRGERMLNHLDTIKVGILSGNLTIGQVIDVADVVASHRETVSDPRLTAILDEIDLRAQIELAKLKKAL
ncbi:MAG: flagellar assembly protein FliX [Pseudomonadota bacterium]